MVGTRDMGYGEVGRSVWCHRGMGPGPGSLQFPTVSPLYPFSQFWTPLVDTAVRSGPNPYPNLEAFAKMTKKWSIKTVIFMKVQWCQWCQNPIQIQRKSAILSKSEKITKNSVFPIFPFLTTSRTPLRIVKTGTFPETDRLRGWNFTKMHFLTILTIFSVFGHFWTTFRPVFDTFQQNQQNQSKSVKTHGET